MDNLPGAGLAEDQFDKNSFVQASSLHRHSVPLPFQASPADPGWRSSTFGSSSPPARAAGPGWPAVTVSKASPSPQVTLSTARRKKQLAH